MLPNSPGPIQDYLKLPTIDPKPVTLEGEKLRLEPLTAGHLDALAAVGCEPEIWRWYPYVIDSKAAMKVWIDELLAGQAKGASQTFVTTIKETGEVVGSSSYLNIDRRNRRVEIGSTWLTPKWQRSYVNTEAKLLMLGHAFEKLGCLRVELKTDALNERSRTAIVRIGAKEEGTLRAHMVIMGGRLRDTVYYSILENEWPALKPRLRSKE